MLFGAALSIQMQLGRSGKPDLAPHYVGVCKMQIKGRLIQDNISGKFEPLPIFSVEERSRHPVESKSFIEQALTLFPLMRKLNA